VSGTSGPKLPFERLGDYEVVAPIAEGGMASVWLGRSTARGGELVALKVIREDHGRNKDFIAMLVDEASIASRMVHPNILPIRRMGLDGKRHFLVMDLLRGHSLLEVVTQAHARGKRLPMEVVAWLGARVADALHYAHELKDDSGAPFGVVHRDVNPANIFVTNEGVPKLIDFGLAKARDRIASTEIGIVKGKLAYLSPEQARGHAADRRSDVFALGVTLWETSLDRRLFFQTTDVETVQRVRDADVPDPSTVEDGYPSGLADALVRALAREPSERWQTAADLRDALDAFVSSTGKPTDASSVRAALRDLFADEAPAAWQRLADEATAEQERTRVWDERTVPLEAPRPAAPPAPAPPAPALASAVAPAPALAPSPASAPASAPAPSYGLVAASAASALLAGLLVAALGRTCQGGERSGLEARVARIEDLLGLAEAGLTAIDRAPMSPDGGSTLSADEREGPCARAKIAAYRAWQEAVAKSKLGQRPAEAACAGISNEKKKQACFFAAETETRTVQAARDAVIAGGAAAREAVKSAKDSGRNDALAAARTASEVAFAACGDEGTP
jgi:serine/threonine-protein kinase